jgi:hypothetical protein
MIKYSLMCDKRHFFEIQFNTNKMYKEAMLKKNVKCSICSSKNVYLSRRHVDDILEIKNIIDEFKHSILKNYSFADKKIISDLLKIGKQSKLKNKQKNIFGFITDYKDMDKIIESNIDCIVLPIELNINNKKNQSKH